LPEYFIAELQNTKIAYDTVKARRDEVSSRCRLLASGSQTLEYLLDKVVETGQHAGSELNISTTVSDIHNDVEGMCNTFSSWD